MRAVRHTTIPCRGSRLVALIVVLLLAPSDATAQRAPICDSTRLQETHGIGKDTLRLILRRPGGGARPDPRFAIAALDAMRRHFSLPARLGLSFRVPLDDSSSTFGLIASVDFVALRDGHVTAVRISRTSYVPALDDALLTALRRASDEAAFAPFEPRESSDRLPLVLDVAFGLEDSTRTGIDAALIERPRHAALLLPRVIEPQRMPRLRNAREAGSQLGVVDMTFGVNEQGRVVPGTVEFRRVTTTPLARAVLKVLPLWRFEPARIAGCAVPALVSQAFKFTFPP